MKKNITWIFFGALILRFRKILKGSVAHVLSNIAVMLVIMEILSSIFNHEPRQKMMTGFVLILIFTLIFFAFAILISAVAALQSKWQKLFLNAVIQKGENMEYGEEEEIRKIEKATETKIWKVKEKTAKAQEDVKAAQMFLEGIDGEAQKPVGA